LQYKLARLRFAPTRLAIHQIFSVARFSPISKVDSAPLAIRCDRCRSGIALGGGGQQALGT